MMLLIGVHFRKVTINGNAQIGSNAILVSDRLSENKIEVNNSDIKNRILLRNFRI